MRLFFITLFALFLSNQAFPQRISELPPATYIGVGDLSPIVQNGVTKKLPYSALIGSLHFFSDSIYVSYRCHKIKGISNWYFSGDTVFIDTCSVNIPAAADSCLFELRGDTIWNKNGYKVMMNDSVYFMRDAIRYLHSGEPLGGFLTLAKLDATGRRQLVMSSFRSDSIEGIKIPLIVTDTNYTSSLGSESVSFIDLRVHNDTLFLGSAAGRLNDMIFVARTDYYNNSIVINSPSGIYYKNRSYWNMKLSKTMTGAILQSNGTDWYVIGVLFDQYSSLTMASFPDSTSFEEPVRLNSSIQASNLDSLYTGYALNIDPNTGQLSFVSNDSIWDAIYSLTAFHTFDPDASTITRGTVISGTVDSLDFHDKQFWKIREVTGAIGLNFQAIFDSVDSPINRVLFHGYYQGNHSILLQLWNYDDSVWETYTSLTNASNPQWIEFTIIDPDEHVRNDSALIRFYHPENGNASHYFYGDYLAIVNSGSVNSSPGSSDTTWSKNGGDIYPTNITDSVGINNSNPQYNLDVIGKINFNATSTSSTGILYQNGSPIFHNYPNNANPSFRNLWIGGAGNLTMPSVSGGLGIGHSALSNISSGDWNLAIGILALNNLTTGDASVCIGYYSGISVFNNMSYSTIVGSTAGQYSGSYNQYFGSNSGRYNKGSYNTAIGYAALLQGSSSGYYGYGVGNIAIGHESQKRSSNTDATEDYNISIGTFSANKGFMEGDSNLIISHGWGNAITVKSDKNLFLMTGNNPFDSIHEFDNNIFISTSHITSGDGLHSSNHSFQNRFALGGHYFNPDSTKMLFWANLLNNNLTINGNTTINGSLKANLDSASTCYSVYYNKTTKGFSYDSTGSSQASFELDPIYAGDSASIVHFADTTGRIVAKKQLADTAAAIRGDLPAGIGYSITLGCASTIPTSDGTTWYLGNGNYASSAGSNRFYCPIAGHVTKAHVNAYFGSSCSGEEMSIYLVVNSVNPTLIQSVTNNSAQKQWYNYNMNVAVSAGDYINIKMVNPTWATNPSGGTNGAQAVVFIQ